MTKAQVTRSSETSVGIVMTSDSWIFPDGRKKSFRRMDAERLVSNRRKSYDRLALKGLPS
jgi:hypothetical protein